MTAVVRMRPLPEGRAPLLTRKATDNTSACIPRWTKFRRDSGVSCGASVRTMDLTAVTGGRTGMAVVSAAWGRGS